MEECLFVDAHAFQLQIACLQQRNGHWHVTETHRYSEVTDEKQWTKTFEKSWGSIARHAPKEIVFILPDAFVGNLSVPINGDVNFSVEQRLQRALLKNFRFQFQKYCYRFTLQAEQRCHVQFIAKKQLEWLQTVTECASNVHFFSSVTACWNYFNALTIDRWPHIALFLEPPLRRLFVYTEQSVRYVDFYNSPQEPSSQNFCDWTIFSMEASGIDIRGKRLTVIGNLSSEATIAVREELHADVISEFSELSGDVSSLSVVSQAICVGTLSLLRDPKNPLAVFDFSTVKFPLLSKRLKHIFQGLILANLIFLCISSIACYQTRQSVHEKEACQKRLLQQRLRLERLNAREKRLEEENQSRFLLPKTFLHIVDRLRALDIDACLDELSTEISPKGTFVVLKGRTEAPRETFHRALQDAFKEEITKRALPIDWHTGDDRRNAFVLKIPVTSPKKQGK